MEISQLPALNASLNGLSALFLASGYVLIRNRRRKLHRACMLSAFAATAAFLVSYLIYHAHHLSTPFTGTGPVRYVYYTILLTHIVLAVAVVPLALTTLYRALRGQEQRHRRIARWTLPIWLYVSVTGGVVYLMLYHLYA